MKALVSGWFSFPDMGATAGDLLSRDVVCDWLVRLGCAYDIALAPPFEGGVDWRQVNPAEYTHLIFVCGPFGRSWDVTSFLERFNGTRLIGVNLSMMEALETWNPFDLLLERDSSRTARPDLSFLAPPQRVPLIGLVLIDAQPEYRQHDIHRISNGALLELVSGTNGACVRIDTRLDRNTTGLRTAAEIESLIARMDVVLTSRMHGLVLSLKNGVPVVAIDPVAGGAKVLRQAQTIGWPHVFDGERVDRAALRQAFEHCLTPAGRNDAEQCRAAARALLATTPHEFATAFTA